MDKGPDISGHGLHGAGAEDGQSEQLPVPGMGAPWEQRLRAQHRPGSTEARTSWVLITHFLIARAALANTSLARNLAACITIFQETNYKCFLISSTIHSPFLNQHRKQLS